MNFFRPTLIAGITMISLQATAADPLPRVFFTPQERTEIVQHRSVVVRTAPGAAVPAPGAAAPAAAPVAAAADANNAAAARIAPPVLRLEGLSVASSGATFAWIGGQRYANGARVAGHRLDISAQGVVMVDASGRSRPIRVGEALNESARATRAAP